MNTSSFTFNVNNSIMIYLFKYPARYLLKSKIYNLLEYPFLAGLYFIILFLSTIIFPYNVSSKTSKPLAPSYLI